MRLLLIKFTAFTKSIIKINFYTFHTIELTTNKIINNNNTVSEFISHKVESCDEQIETVVPITEDIDRIKLNNYCLVTYK